jgi:hypothetical protein
MLGVVTLPALAVTVCSAVACGTVVVGAAVSGAGNGSCHKPFVLLGQWITLLLGHWMVHSSGVNCTLQPN